MVLSELYKQQFRWRPWKKIFDNLPLDKGQTVMDLGCSVGDQAAEFVARGARVVGVDGNEELLHEARSRNLAGVEFLNYDLSSFNYRGEPVDGIWCSFTAAYFPNLKLMLRKWSDYLRPGGWIALTEIDDLFGHLPLSPNTVKLFDDFACEAYTDERYDFYMGRKLREHLDVAGYRLSKELILEDRELSFNGPACPEVIAAWNTRFERLQMLQVYMGNNFERIRWEFLRCLELAEHRSNARVYCCIATNALCNGCAVSQQSSGRTAGGSLSVD